MTEPNDQEQETPEVGQDHPDNIEMLPFDAEPDFGGDPVQADDTGLDDLLPAVTDDEPIVGD